MNELTSSFCSPATLMPPKIRVIGIWMLLTVRTAAAHGEAVAAHVPVKSRASGALQCHVSASLHLTSPCIHFSIYHTVPPPMLCSHIGTDSTDEHKSTFLGEEEGAATYINCILNKQYLFSPNYKCLIINCSRADTWQAVGPSLTQIRLKMLCTAHTSQPGMIIKCLWKGN